MREELTALRRAMQAHTIDAYLIPTDDFHGSEYVGDHFKCRAYLSGFTGSAGTLIVFSDHAALFTDGRYFLQAEQQLAGSGITLYKSGQSGVPTPEQLLLDRLPEGGCLGFDGRTVSCRYRQTLTQTLSAKAITLCTALDLVGGIWPQRPPLSAEPVWALADDVCGQPRADKLIQLRRALAEKNADLLVLSSLDDIAWLLNLRGNDVACCPVFLSYLVVRPRDAIVYANPAVFSDVLKAALERDGIQIRPYDAIYSELGALSDGMRVAYDPEKLNCALDGALADNAVRLPGVSPTTLSKAVKNPVEVRNSKAAHLHDGVALTRWLFWLKQTVGKAPLDELSAAERLETFRREQPHYLGPSFAPILAYGAHGAIVHYSATESSCVPLQAEGFLLADTGGHYLGGTTDVTRTIALGTLSDAMRHHYTTVLRGNLSLLSARFPSGCRGSALDALARRPLWDERLDYNHGTGHGVGYLLNVHEGPNSFRFRSAGEDAVLRPGMITSDEPGLYLAGEYGIRLENLILCQEDCETEFGHFLHFDALTLVPFDRAAIVAEELTPAERQTLNAYHQTVCDALSPFLPAAERDWLCRETAPL